MKDLKFLQDDLGELIGQYCDKGKLELKSDDFPLQHDFFNILESVEYLIKNINKEVE